MRSVSLPCHLRFHGTCHKHPAVWKRTCSIFTVIQMGATKKVATPHLTGSYYSLCNKLLQVAPVLEWAIIIWAAPSKFVQLHEEFIKRTGNLQYRHDRCYLTKLQTRNHGHDISCLRCCTLEKMRGEAIVYIYIYNIFILLGKRSRRFRKKNTA